MEFCKWIKKKKQEGKWIELVLGNTYTDYKDIRPSGSVSSKPELQLSSAFKFITFF